MSGFRRIFFVVVGILLLLSLVVGCKKDKDDVAEVPSKTVSQDPQSAETDGEDQAQPTTDSGSDEVRDEGTAFGTLDEAPKWDFDVSANFEAWDSEMPFINPMGNKEAYSEILYSEDSGGYFYYLDENNISKDRAVYGETYLLEVPFDEDKTTEDNLSFIKDIGAYVDGIDGTIVGESKDKVLFVADDAEENHWWCEVSVFDSGFEMTIVKEREIKLGETMKIDTSKYEDNVLKFTSYHDGKNNQTVTSEMHRGSSFLSIFKNEQYGAYSRSYNYSIHLESYQGIVDVLDDAMLFDRALSYEQIQSLYTTRGEDMAAPETYGGENWRVRVTGFSASEVGNNLITGSELIQAPDVSGVTLIAETSASLSDEDLTASFSSNASISSAIASRNSARLLPEQAW